MSLPLKDFRTGINESPHAALEARAAALGTDMQTVARDVLAEWAARDTWSMRAAWRPTDCRRNSPDSGWKTTD